MDKRKVEYRIPCCGEKEVVALKAGLPPSTVAHDGTPVRLADVVSWEDEVLVIQQVPGAGFVLYSLYQQLHPMFSVLESILGRMADHARSIKL